MRSLGFLKSDSNRPLLVTRYELSAPEDEALTSAIGFVGDVHDDDQALRAILHAGRAHGVADWILLGDLEFRPREMEGRRFIESVGALAAEIGARLRFVRGNHDDADALEELVRGADAPVEVASGLELVPDGTVFELAGVRLLAAGGSPTAPGGAATTASPDASMAPEALARCMRAGPVDVVIAHDCPNEVPIPIRHRYWGGQPGRNHRKKMSELARTVRPRWWISGHYHCRISTLVSVTSDDRCRVEVLNRNGSGPDQVLIATAETLLRPGDDRKVSPGPGRTTTNVITLRA